MPSNPDPSNSGKFSRPIDPPSLPPWSRGAEDRPTPLLTPAPMPDDETPTLSGDAFPDAPEEEDPKDLARRLAQEAKQRALAARKPGAQESQMRPEDPRELARRLAEEAKKRIHPSAAPAPATDPEPSITSWDQPAVRADHQDSITDAEPEAEFSAYEPISEPSGPLYAERTTAGAAPFAAPDAISEDGETEDPYDPDPDPPPNLPSGFSKGKSLAERAAPLKPKTGMSAAEALAAARLAEAQARSRPSSQTPTSAPARPAHTARLAPQPQAPTPAPQAAQPPAQRPVAPSRSPATDLASTFAALIPGASVEPPIPVTQVDVFRALWRAHKARAIHDHQLELVATAGVLLDAVDRLPPGHLVAARVSLGGAVFAVWVDLDRQVLLGAAKPAEIYLAGL